MTGHEARIAKFKRRAPSIQSQAHLDKIIASFAPEHRQIAIAAVSGILPEKLVPDRAVVSSEVS